MDKYCPNCGAPKIESLQDFKKNSSLLGHYLAKRAMQLGELYNKNLEEKSERLEKENKKLKEKLEGLKEAIK